MSITSDTRFDSMKKIDKTRMYGMIIAALKSASNKGLTAKGLTARECSTVLYNQGKIYDSGRQATAPRLTELEDKGVVQIIGKRLDNITNRNVAVYALVS